MWTSRAEIPAGHDPVGNGRERSVIPYRYRPLSTVVPVGKESPIGASFLTDRRQAAN